PEEDPDRSTPCSVFGSEADWFVFEDADRSAPDVLGFAHVARRLRHALMSLSPQPPPEVVSGHAPDGSASQRPHAAIVPMLDVGWEHSTGRLLGLAVVLPRSLSPDERDAALLALARFARVDQGPQALAQLRFARLTWSLRRVALAERASLDPARWCGSATTWASATPVVMDRFADRDDP